MNKEHNCNFKVVVKQKIMYGNVQMSNVQVLVNGIGTVNRANGGIAIII